MKVDLHCHSQHSDGSDTVLTLYQKAIDNNLSKLALTDHDSISGLEELERLCRNGPVEWVSGIEISTRWKKHDIHVVGLYIEPNHPAIKNAIEFQQKQRLERAKKIASCLEALGVDNCWKRVQALAGEGQITRPHFAKILLEDGKVKNMQAAFTRYLSRGKPAYVTTEWLSLERTVESIHAAGGVSILAHPLKYKLTNTKLNELFEHFKSVGGRAVEVISGIMSSKEISTMIGFSQRYELLASTGSDYHGDSISRIGLGGQAELPADCSPVWQIKE